MKNDVNILTVKQPQISDVASAFDILSKKAKGYLIDKAKELIDEKFKPDGYNIGMNLGEKAGQSIMHLHV